MIVIVLVIAIAAIIANALLPLIVVLQPAIAANVPMIASAMITVYALQTKSATKTVIVVAATRRSNNKQEVMEKACIETNAGFFLLKNGGGTNSVRVSPWDATQARN